MVDLCLLTHDTVDEFFRKLANQNKLPMNALFNKIILDIKKQGVYYDERIWKLSELDGEHILLEKNG